uniref:LAGLIDADG endonuclease n=1 Tax=Daedaleopsis nitida TaxID=1140402 RepID=UPI0030E4DDAC
MQKIIDHFYKFPLITNKYHDYKLFKLAYILIVQKEHLSLEGIKKLVSIKCSMNLGLSPELKAHFTDIKAQAKDKISYYKIPDPHWLASSGEACFIVDINRSKSNQIGYSVNLRIMISQHARDELLLCSLINYFNCGKLYKNNNCFNLTVRKFADIDTKIIPFFIKYPILGNKFLDFLDFCKVSKLVKEKKHLQIDGLKKISLIKSGMNTTRIRQFAR